MTNSLMHLTNELLLETYNNAIELECDLAFILLLKKEIDSRKLNLETRSLELVQNV